LLSFHSTMFNIEHLRLFSAYCERISALIVLIFDGCIAAQTNKQMHIGPIAIPDCHAVATYETAVPRPIPMPTGKKAKRANDVLHAAFNCSPG
jgi:hypothetical protein